MFHLSTNKATTPRRPSPNNSGNLSFVWAPFESSFREFYVASIPYQGATKTMRFGQSLCPFGFRECQIRQVMQCKVIMRIAKLCWNFDLLSKIWCARGIQIPKMERRSLAAVADHKEQLAIFRFVHFSKPIEGNSVRAMLV